MIECSSMNTDCVFPKGTGFMHRCKFGASDRIEGGLSGADGRVVTSSYNTARYSHSGI